MGTHSNTAVIYNDIIFQKYRHYGGYSELGDIISDFKRIGEEKLKELIQRMRDASSPQSDGDRIQVSERSEDECVFLSEDGLKFVEYGYGEKVNSVEEIYNVEFTNIIDFNERKIKCSGAYIESFEITFEEIPSSQEER